MGVQCDTGERTLELLRGIRLHASSLLKGMSEGDLSKAQLGLGHSYSRSKVKFNVNRSDNMIIQAIALLDVLDKDVNTFSMRVREWYGWHFPELVKLINDNLTYAKLVVFIRNKERLEEEHLDGLTEILDGDETNARNVLDASRASMGTEIGEQDMLNIGHFAERVVQLAEYRKSMSKYLQEKMHLVAPNVSSPIDESFDSKRFLFWTLLITISSSPSLLLRLQLSALIGETIGARLISHAGSLTNLAKYPASTVQILGAEKALFRALKTKGNTPKYGLLYHASAIARAAPKNKGRMSRFVANKISIASRIDCFSDKPSSKFGEVLHLQVEERLQFYETGKAPGKNSDAMKKAIEAIEEEAGDLMDVDKDDDDEDEDEEMQMPNAVGVVDPADEKKKSKKEKKEKKEKKSKSKSGDKVSQLVLITTTHRDYDYSSKVRKHSPSWIRRTDLASSLF